MSMEKSLEVLNAMVDDGVIETYVLRERWPRCFISSQPSLKT
jgi:hypothetical protein